MSERDGNLALDQGLYLASQAARICRVSSQQLRYWTRTRLVVPHVHPGDHRVPPLYSYSDLLAIRAVQRLRSHRLSLQRIRKAVDYLHDILGQRRDWYTLKMVTDGEDLFTVLPREQTAMPEDELVVATRSGQKPFELVFADLVSDLLGGGELSKFPEIQRYVVIDARVQGGAPVIRGTRLPTSTIAGWDKRGLRSDEIVQLYSGIDKVAVEAALRYERILAKRPA